MEKLPTSSKALRYLPFLVASAFFMQMLDATILNTAIPTIARSFNSHPLQLHSLVTAYGTGGNPESVSGRKSHVKLRRFHSHRD